MISKEQVQKGFTKTEAENHPDYSKQEKEALNQLKKLLYGFNAKDYREFTNEIFFAFLSTEGADHKPTRTKMILFHYELINFFTKLHKIPLIDRFRNL